MKHLSDALTVAYWAFMGVSMLVYVACRRLRGASPPIGDESPTPTAGTEGT